ncbi:hypothetical protein B1M_06760, partial [Burkholderia sp. TJI49]
TGHREFIAGRTARAGSRRFHFRNVFRFRRAAARGDVT